MTLPVMPSTHRWFRGGPGLSKVGQNALFADDSTRVWVWDEETGDPVVDILDEHAQQVTMPTLDDGWLLGAGLPLAVRVASFSLGKGGKRFPLEPANSLALTQEAQAAASSSAADASSSASSAAASAALVGAPAKSAMDAAMGGDVAGLVPAVAARIQVTEAPLMPEKYGAVGDGTTDDTAAFTAMAAVANGATGRPQIRLLEKSYRTTAPINITRAGWHVQGYSRFAGSRIVNAVSDVFTFGASNAGTRHYFHDLRITASAGHIFSVTNGSFSLNHLERLNLEQQNAGKSILNQTSGDHLDNLYAELELTGTTGHTVPYWKVLSATGGANENTFQRGRSTYSGNYVFWFEETATGQYSNGNVIDGWNFEIPNGGCVMGLSANGWELRECNVYDLAGFNGGVTTKDLFVLGKSTGPASRYNALKHVVRHGGTLGSGLYDIKLQGASSAPLTHIEQCDTSSGSGYKIDLGLNSAISLLDLGGNVTVDNRGAQVYQNNGTSVGFFGATPVSGRAANPGTATGTDAAVINNIVTALRNLGIIT